MKKILSLLLVAVMIFAVAVSTASCESSNDADFKIGFILLHDEHSTYDKNFLDAAKAVQAELGLTNEQVLIKTNVGEDNSCYEAACELVEQGCKIVFADSFGHEPFMLKAAKEHPEVQFCHATGTTAHTEKVANFHNAFASIYEGRYLAGVVAGLKLNEMISAGTITADKAKMGYVGAFPYAEVKSGYTSFYLGAKSVCPTVTMEVNFTQSWYNVDDERNNALALIERGCVLISQHADSMGAPSACEEKNVPNVSYNGSTLNECPNTFLVSSKIDWAPYYKYIIDCVKTNKTIADDWTGTLKSGSVVLTEINDKACASGTKEKLDAVKAELTNGTRKVFDTTTFTVGGAALTEYKADVDTDAAFTPDTQVIANGEFEESKYRSAPYFDVDIDGITILK